MKLKSVLTLFLLAVPLFFPGQSKAEEKECVIVVLKDGTINATPIVATDRIAFGNSDFTVVSKDGDKESYAYKNVSKVKLGEAYDYVPAIAGDDVSLMVWPSITSSMLNISGHNPGEVISVYSLNGERLISCSPSDEFIQLNVSNLRSGHYILTCGDKSVRFIKK